MKLKKNVNRIILSVIAIAFCTLIGSTSIKAYKNSLLVDGYQFSVDGEVWFTVADEDALKEIISNYQSTYLTGISENATINSIGFVQSVAITPVRVDQDELIPIEDAQQQITANVKEAVYHTVVDGDTLWDISKSLDISFYDFVNLNSDIDIDKIWPGDELLLEPADPVLDVLVKIESTVIEDLPYTTQYITDSSLYSSQREVVTAGVNGEKEVTYDIDIVNGYESASTITNMKVLSVSSMAVVKVGTKRTLTIISSSNYGVVKGTLTSGYGWRTDPISGKKAFHDGIDIGASCGTLVYAYASGTVTEAGWNNTRGNYIVISHGSGLTTRYLHLSKIYVSVGDSVSVGEKIGAVGKTGYATGCHLHFGVHVYGETANPFDYI